jgi:hypothetical protein
VRHDAGTNGDTDNGDVCDDVVGDVDGGDVVVGDDSRAAGVLVGKAARAPDQREGASDGRRVVFN